MDDEAKDASGFYEFLLKIPGLPGDQVQPLRTILNFSGQKMQDAVLLVLCPLQISDLSLFTKSRRALSRTTSCHKPSGRISFDPSGYSFQPRPPGVIAGRIPCNFNSDRIRMRLLSFVLDPLCRSRCKRLWVSSCLLGIFACRHTFPSPFADSRKGCD
jgi:hypothetical protein